MGLLEEVEHAENEEDEIFEASDLDDENGSEENEEEIFDNFSEAQNVDAENANAMM